MTKHTSNQSPVTFVTHKCFAVDRLLPAVLLRELEFTPEYVYLCVIFSMAFLEEGLLSEVWLF